MLKNLKITLLLSPLIFTFINCRAEIPTVNNATIFADSNSSLSGVVMDYNHLNLISGAEIKLNEYSSVSDKKGTYDFKGLKPGEYNVIITKTGYENLSLKINIKGKMKKDFLLKSLNIPSVSPTPFPQITEIKND